MWVQGLCEASCSKRSTSLIGLYELRTRRMLRRPSEFCTPTVGGLAELFGGPRCFSSLSRICIPIYAELLEMHRDFPVPLLWTS